MMPASTAKWEDLPNELSIDSDRLHKMNLDLELVMIAITALAQIDRQEIGQIAEEIDPQMILADWRREWPHVKFTVAKQLDLAQLRSLVSIVNRLARKYQMVVRQTMTDWQQLIRVDRLPLESPSLAAYIDNFIIIYQARLSDEAMDSEATHSLESLSQAALNLLLELLFYGGNNGHQRLWQGLLQRSQAAVIPRSRFNQAIILQHK
jgi:transposase-like protein